MQNGWKLIYGALLSTVSQSTTCKLSSQLWPHTLISGTHCKSSQWRVKSGWWQNKRWCGCNVNSVFQHTPPQLCQLSVWCAGVEVVMWTLCFGILSTTLTVVCMMRWCRYCSVNSLFQRTLRLPAWCSRVWVLCFCMHSLLFGIPFLSTFCQVRRWHRWCNTYCLCFSTPLHNAIFCKNDAVVRVLLEHQLNLEIKNSDGHTALWLALKQVSGAVAAGGGGGGGSTLQSFYRNLGWGGGWGGWGQGLGGGG